ncbi:MAG: FliM/FliN family flagellar motor switch protein [Hyphomonadaceae bacterium]|jgi:flagellar motor switch protein FliM|nr:FliM/FliN family flagellar motor switch protein [Hyphomonadaceae bacterium]
MSGAGARAENGRDSLAELFAGSSNFVERVPMLRVAFERAAATCTESFASATVQPPQIALQKIESGTAVELLGAHDRRSAIGVLHAAKWNARLLVSADRGAVFAMVEALLGGDGAQPAQVPDRQLSRIEMRIVGIVFDSIARALEAAFAGIADTTFAVEGTAEEIDYDVVGRRNNPVVVARLRLEVAGRGGEVLIAATRAALNPLRQALGHTPTRQGPPADARWTQQMQSGVTRAHVLLTAVLDERMGLLGEVAGFKVGQVVELNATAHGRVRLECNGERLMWCHLGKSQDKYTLRVDELVDREQEFLNEILSG